MPLFSPRSLKNNNLLDAYKSLVAGSHQAGYELWLRLLPSALPAAGPAPPAVPEERVGGWAGPHRSRAAVAQTQPEDGE